MRRALTLPCLLVLGSVGTTDDKVPAPAEERAKLQGVSESTADVRQQLKIMFLDDKVGYVARDPKAKPPAPVSASLALSPAKHAEAQGKRRLEVQVTKDYSQKVEYRFDKDDLVVVAGGTEYKTTRTNSRASADPAAKKLLGTWTVTGMEAKGKEAAAAAGGMESITFTEDRYVVKAPGGKEVFNSFYRLDAKAEPPALDWWGLRPDFVIRLIYEQTGDELRLAHPPLQLVGKGEAKRPTTFDTKETDTIVIRAKRAK